MMKKDRIRLFAILLVSAVVLATGLLYLLKAYQKGDIAGGILGVLVTLIVLGFAVFVFVRGSKDLRQGFPLHDERSRMVMQKASSRAFFISLYLLLAVGFISDFVPFRDVSQATGITVGIMALIFGICWAYYNRK